ncbi:MAG: hypothetical protein Q8P44_05085, partial [Dehalococcoidia bacterium]|nr:hypothetical protein [Dehalococcoidia bacterium]
ISVNKETLESSSPGVFAGGDAVSGPASEIEAIAAGRRAATAIDKYLGGDGIIDEVLATVKPVNHTLGRDEDFAGWQRSHLKSISLEKRTSTFEQSEIGFSADDAVKEARRCYSCNLRLCVPKVKMPPEEDALGRVKGVLVSNIRQG